MKIIHLKNDIYQVVDESIGTTFHQGTYIECQSYIQLYQFKDNPFFKEFLNLINPTHEKSN